MSSAASNRPSNRLPTASNWGVCNTPHTPLSVGRAKGRLEAPAPSNLGRVRRLMAASGRWRTTWSRRPALSHQLRSLEHERTVGAVGTAQHGVKARRQAQPGRGGAFWGRDQLTAPATTKRRRKPSLAAALNDAQKAHTPVKTAVVEPDGKIVLTFGEPETGGAKANEWDTVLHGKN